MTQTKSDALVVQRAYELTLWLLPKMEKFPRDYKFTLGERMAATSLQLLEGLASAAYASDKRALLAAASHHVNVLRYLLRLAKDLKLLSIDSYGFAAEHLDEIGRMTGGWRKSLDGRP